MSPLPPPPADDGTSYTHLDALLGQVVEVKAVEYLDDGIPVFVIDGHRYFGSSDWTEECAAAAEADLNTGNKVTGRVVKVKDAIGLVDPDDKKFAS